MGHYPQPAATTPSRSQGGYTYANSTQYADFASDPSQYEQQSGHYASEAYEDTVDSAISATGYPLQEPHFAPPQNYVASYAGSAQEHSLEAGSNIAVQQAYASRNEMNAYSSNQTVEPYAGYQYSNATSSPSQHIGQFYNNEFMPEEFYSTAPLPTIPQDHGLSIDTHSADPYGVQPVWSQSQPQADQPRARITGVSEKSKRVHTFADAGFDSEASIQRDGDHARYDLGPGAVVPQSTFKGRGLGRPGCKPPIDFKINGKLGINLHEVLNRTFLRSPLEDLKEEVSLMDAPLTKRGGILHLHIQVSIL